MKLTENFTLEEMISTTKKIDNTPTKEVIENLSVLCRDVLQPIRDEWGEAIIVSSGYRCYALNKAVGGVNGSQHLCGTAADIHTKSNKKKDNKDLFKLIECMAKMGKIHFRQLIDEKGYSWIHISIQDKQHTYRDCEVLHSK